MAAEGAVRHYDQPLPVQPVTPVTPMPDHLLAHVPTAATQPLPNVPAPVYLRLYSSADLGSRLA